MLPVAGKPDSFIFIADRWNKTNLRDSRYIWLPIQFKENSFVVPWQDSWRSPMDIDLTEQANSLSPSYTPPMKKGL
jgi:hypothetical protein